jgi:NitT/TauT family transport system substrate-binding protein
MTELDTSKGGIPYMIANGDVDLAMDFGAVLINGIDAGHSLTVLTGIHAGCFELFANSGISGIKDLKDRTVGIRSQGLSKQLVSLMVSYVGLDPVKDIHWVADPSVAPMQRFIDGKIDAFLASAPQPQELRARKIGHVLVNSSVDHPWSNYFCCMLAGNKEFVRRYPVATKRALRAILKTADLCASDPKRAAQLMTDRGFDVPFDYLLQGLSEIRYDVWRDYDPEDTLRFYTLRMQEVGMIKSSPQKILAQGTDWHFLNELKRELKT